MSERFDAPALVRLRRVTAAVPSPDGTWLAVAAQRLDREKEASYVSDIWRVPLDGGEPTELTHSKWNDHSPQFLHDGSLAFLSNRPTNTDDDHDKRSQVFVFRPWGGEPRALTDEPLGVSRFVAAANTDVLCLMTSLIPGVPEDEQRDRAKERREKGPTELVYDRMPVRFWDHWLPEEVPHLVAYVDGERRDLWPDVDGELRRAAFAVSPDGRYVAVHPSAPASDRIRDSYAELFDLVDGSRRTLAREDRAWFGAPCFSPDGKSLAMTYHQREDGRFGQTQLIVASVETDEWRRIDGGWEDGFFPDAWTPDGRQVIATSPYRTHRPVFTIDVDSAEVTRITSKEAGGTHLGISVMNGDSPAVVGVRSALTQAPEPFVCPLKPGADPEVAANISGFEGADFVETEYHEVESTDGAPVQYSVVKPTDCPDDAPVLMWIHGGPISDWGDVWHWRWNSLIPAAAGYVTILPNPRGSVGFGSEFVEGIWNNTWGGQCFEDLMAVADEVAQRSDTDSDRMVAMGGSFGGYMTNWIGTQTDRFRCLVTHASLFDLAAFHGVTDSPAWWAHSFGVHPYGEREEFDTYSPLAHVSKWTSPVLIIHGEKDYRVPIGEALAMFEALDFHDVEAKLLIYPDENHWILRPNNIESWYGHVLDYIGSHVA